MSTLDLQSLIRENVRSLKAYHVDHFDCEVKLHANEISYPIDGDTLEQFISRLRTIPINRYPDPGCSALKSIIADRLNVESDQLVIGNGSDELIQVLLQIFCEPGETIAFPDPTFAMYGITAKALGIGCVPVALNDEWDFSADSFLDAISEHNPKIVFFSFPNNPTGNCFNREAIQRVLSSYNGIVVLDEAYFDFARSSFLDELTHHNNLIVLRSLSKIGLAALRVGYGIAAPEIIHEMDKVRLPYNSNAISQTFSEIVLSDYDRVESQIDHIIAERKRLTAELEQLPGVTPFKSDANFILFRNDTGAVDLFKGLADLGILIRDLGSHPRLKHCLRVTVGTTRENNLFLEGLQTLTRAR